MEQKYFMEDSTNNTGEAAAAPKNKTMLYVTVGVVLLVALGVGYHLLTNVVPEYTDNAGTENATGPVAIVNGEEISRETYDQTYAQYQAIFGTESGVTEAQLKEQTVTDLVNTVLIRQTAIAEGYAATDAEIDAEISAITEGAGGAEAFAAQLDQAGVSQEEVRRQVGEQLAMNAYVQEAAAIEGITVTDAEITSFYEQVTAGDSEAPALEEIRAQIEAQIEAQKQQERIAALIAELRADADIQILI